MPPPSRLLLVLVCLLALGPTTPAGRAADEAASPHRLRITTPPKTIVFAVAFSPDGKLLAVACLDKCIYLYDTATGEQRAVLRGHTERVWSIAFSPDGKTLVSGSGEWSKPTVPGEIKVWDVAAGKEKASLTGHQGLVFNVAFTPDGKRVASGSWDNTVKLWDPATGKEQATLKGHEGPVRAVVYSPDGKLLATGSFDGTVRLWDAATDREQKVIAAHPAGVQCLAFTRDGKLLATSDRPPPTGGAAEIKLWDVATGKERATFAGLARHILSLDFSPDGRVLAMGGGYFQESGEVKLVEVASGKERADLKGHKEWVECVKFSPDGRVLISGGGMTPDAPGEFHVWHMDDLYLGKPGIDRLAADQLTTLWDALAGEDAAKAYQAGLELRLAPRSTVPFLKERLRPAVPADPKQIAKLIRDLDNDDFNVRQEATEALEKLDDQARPALEEVLASPPSAEVNRRAEDLLHRVGIAIKAPELLRAVRAIEVLEASGAPEAEQLLKDLARGAPAARLTQEAQAALARLGRQRGEKP